MCALSSYASFEKHPLCEVDAIFPSSWPTLVRKGINCELLNTYLINSYFCGPSSGDIFCPSSSIGGNDLFLPRVILMSPEPSGDARQIEIYT